MLKIGDFSRIGHVSVETLRNYDEIGLLRAYQTVTEIKFPVEKT
jgi:DNA-binding transcriptional MerR regulator